MSEAPERARARLRTSRGPPRGPREPKRERANGIPMRAGTAPHVPRGDAERIVLREIVGADEARRARVPVGEGAAPKNASGTGGLAWRASTGASPAASTTRAHLVEPCLRVEVAV